MEYAGTRKTSYNIRTNVRIMRTAGGKHADDFITSASRRGKTTTEQLSASEITPTEVAAERLITGSEVVPANSVGSRGEYLMSTLEELRKAGVIDVSPDRHYELMQQVAPRLWRLRYEDGTPVAVLGRPGGRW